MKVKRGWVAIKVGLEEEEFQRFTIPISYLSHPFFKRFLEKAHEAYGYNDVGPLKLPCSVEDFHHLRIPIIQFLLADPRNKTRVVKTSALGKHVFFS
ncbi:hypothetical protein SASPL_157027 [Salvia splendens]|uniref:SAUR family protein n=1 Tax=Salvia splendens TaxID=180675 RepID=A0A8X8VVL7_SALSN|nr:hypothetical protein SASPL_157027 [Salvia splendens]